MNAPKLWTSWEDRRNGCRVTVTNVRGWGRYFSAARRGGGDGTVSCEAEESAPGREPRIRGGHGYGIPQPEFEEHFELIYDPHVGWDRASGVPHPDTLMLTVQAA